jgi:DNA-binding CsgD family transcriptional regulator
LIAVGRITDSVDVARRGVELARTSGLGGPLGPAMATYWLEGLTMLGRWHELELVADEVQDLTNHPAEAGSLAITLGLARIRQGRLDEARPHIEDARAELQRIAWSDNFDYLVAPVAMFDAAEGRLDDAIGLIDRQLQQPPGFSEGVSMLIAVGVGLLADAAGGSHRPPSAAALEQASAWVRLLPPVDAVTHAATWAQADCSRARAEHARLHGKADVAAWTESATRWAALDAAYEEATARLHLAEALLAGTEGRAPAARAAARAELVRAHGIALRIPAPPLADAIRNIARRAGVDLERSMPGDRQQAAPDGLRTLTSRELDVLELLAAGRTNGQIATALYISTKTASVHVSNILRKLGVANRVEAAAVAHRVSGG